MIKLTKLQEAGKSLLWLLGAVMLIAQTYRVMAYYIFEVPFEIIWARDGVVFIAAFALMYLQNGLKTAIRRVLKRKSNDKNVS